LPKLIDYAVRILQEVADALCETIITWTNGKRIQTRGLDSDQTVAAIKATQKC
jgi:D-citramalate synthase